MTAQIRLRDVTGTLRTLSRIRLRDETGTLRTIQRVRIRNTAGVLQTVFQYFQLTLSTTSVSGSSSTSPVVSGSVTVNTVGGTAPFTYAWMQTSGDPLTITSPTSATTTIRKTAASPGTDYYGIFVCTVTDALGEVLTSDEVSATVTRT